MCLLFNLAQQKQRALLRGLIVKLLYLTDKVVTLLAAKKETNKKDSHAFLSQRINILHRLVSRVPNR